MIGRRREIKILQDAFASELSEFVAVYGRRRVGKTFLVNELFGGRYAFQHAGGEKASLREQLNYFRDSLCRYGAKDVPTLANWREALGIAGVLTDFYSWRAKSDAALPSEDAQIDMVIDRGDRIINVCEMKYVSTEYALSPEEATRLRRRVEAFRAGTGTRKGILVTLIASFGVKRNAQSSVVQSVVTLDDLFAEM